MDSCVYRLCHVCYVYPCYVELDLICSYLFQKLLFINLIFHNRRWLTTLYCCSNYVCFGTFMLSNVSVILSLSSVHEALVRWQGWNLAGQNQFHQWLGLFFWPDLEYTQTRTSNPCFYQSPATIPLEIVMVDDSRVLDPLIFLILWLVAAVILLFLIQFKIFLAFTQCDCWAVLRQSWQECCNFVT